MTAAGLIERKLLTSRGEFVGVVTMPDFNPPAEALIWRARVFIFSPANWNYYEGICWYAANDSVRLEE